MNKKSIIYVLIIFIIIFIPINIYANTDQTRILIADKKDSNGGEGTHSSDLGSLDKYKGSVASSEKLEDMAGKILGIIQLVGTSISVTMLMVIGIKYMVGSVEEKATYKKELWPYFIGALLLFSGTYFPQLIYEIIINF